MTGTDDGRCPRCGLGGYRMRYPGDDPENGPAKPTCSSEPCQQTEEFRLCLEALKQRYELGRVVAIDLRRWLPSLRNMKRDELADVIERATLWIEDELADIGPV